MKRLISLLVLFATLCVNAQVIHWITFIDTTDPKLKKYDKPGKANLYSKLISDVNLALQEKGYSSDIHDFDSIAMNLENCNKVLHNLHCESEDIVVFYYIGHGTHRLGDRDSFPQMTFRREDKDSISLRTVHERLKAKNPALLITVGMCCNDTVPTKQGPIYHTIEPPIPFNTRTETQAYQQLFLGYRGDIIVTSASPGQPSWATANTPYYKMDIFTAYFIYHIVTGASETERETEYNWNNILRDVKKSVIEGLDIEHRQDAVYTLNITPIDPVIIDDETKQHNELFNKLSDCLANLFNSQLSSEARKVQLSTLSSMLATEAVIKVVGQDGKTVVDRYETAEDFIGHIEYSRVLKNVIPIRESVKFTPYKRIHELKIKEVY